MSEASVIPLIELAYDLDVRPRDWLQQAGEYLTRLIPGSHNAWGWRMSLTDTFPIIHEAWISGFSGDPVESFSNVHKHLPAAYARVFFQPGTLTGTLNSNLSRIGIPESQLGELHRWIEASGGTTHMMAFGGFDAFGNGVALGLSLPDAPIVARAMESQDRVGVHLNTAWRLREVLGSANPFEQADAVLETNGRLAHASGDARASGEQLTDAVQRIDRARTRGPSESSEALDLWQGLTRGRWSLVDRVDTDGHRYYIAVANPSEGIAARALTTLEQQIVAMAVAGEPNKVIGYALGYAPSTVAGKLKDAMRKLGAPTRIDLIRVGQRLLSRGEKSPAEPA